MIAKVICTVYTSRDCEMPGTINVICHGVIFVINYIFKVCILVSEIIIYYTYVDMLLLTIVKLLYETFTVIYDIC